MRRLLVLLMLLAAVVMPGTVSAASPVVVQRTRDAIDVEIAEGPGIAATRLIASYRLENRKVVETSICLGQFDSSSGQSTWGCGEFDASALAIGARVRTATLSAVSVPVERCGASGCVSATVIVGADLVAQSYDSGRAATRNRVRGCAVVTGSLWESAVAAGTLIVDGVSYDVTPSPPGVPGVTTTISHEPSTTKTTCATAFRRARR